MLNKIISELKQTSRIALSNSDCTRYKRMVYIKKELKRLYPNLVKSMTNKQIWFTIEDHFQF